MNKYILLPWKEDFGDYFRIIFNHPDHSRPYVALVHASDSGRFIWKIFIPLHEKMYHYEKSNSIVEAQQNSDSFLKDLGFKFIDNKHRVML
jgi:hypothetical protein